MIRKIILVILISVVTNSVWTHAEGTFGDWFNLHMTEKQITEAINTPTLKRLEELKIEADLLNKERTKIILSVMFWVLLLFCFVYMISRFLRKNERSIDQRVDNLNELATKYNWFSPRGSIPWISDYIKVSYVYCYWTENEIRQLFSDFEYDLLFEAYDYVKNDWYAFKKKRNKFVRFLLIRKLFRLM
ncbi:MAG: hypothetical protein ACD_3C00086G0045 [uncultured bacterium (gcode 4)]|uniref:Uncharacterized protein n=1 Tax=uncultured bacterium (gcode 4) TaxID=1234023 RepID=K2FAR3_9BACT|nr:MAG: hypothetical protein ACD_3C00086G0045 [uncultured bacterium (gcode 4)]